MGTGIEYMEKVLEAKELAEGLLDITYTIQTAQQDKLIPITILKPFEAVLKQIYLLLKEVEESVEI